jgi:3-dehydro-L-gulonate-6-phosphate decarboxylase
VGSLPMLQLALDYLSLPPALAVTQLVHKEVDIIEVGTLLCNAEGMNAVRTIRAMCPDNIILADVKAADAGNILARMAFDAGADWMTVIGCAPLATAEAALKEARARDKDVQIELTGTWSMSQAEGWRSIGILQVVYHRSRDAQAAGREWGEQDLVTIRHLADMGFRVTVTGGITPDSVPLFQGIPVSVFIAGRAIHKTPDPVASARRFRKVISEHWG